MKSLFVAFAALSLTSGPNCGQHAMTKVGPSQSLIRMCSQNDSRRSPVGRVVYFNDFNSTPGSNFPEWSSPGYSYAAAGVSGSGPQRVTNVRSPNRSQTFLGEFGGPYVVPQGSKPVMRVSEIIKLSLDHLPRHKVMTIQFDLYVLKSWDGDSPQYGSDRFGLSVDSGPSLIDTTFSNNPKVNTDGSTQGYPTPASAPQAGALSIGASGYSDFFKDSVYRFAFSFAHSSESVRFAFSSDLFEGKGTDDESWGLDNVCVRISDAADR
jgi:hypothetical protein